MKMKMNKRDEFIADIIAYCAPRQKQSKEMEMQIDKAVQELLQDEKVQRDMKTIIRKF